MIEKEEPMSNPEKDFDFAINEKPPLVSKFVEKNACEAEETAVDKAYREVTIDDDAPDLEQYDELEAKKKRLHCWIMVRKGERQISESFFIEPTTGRRYEIADSPY
jgi:hypothetical protein